MLDQFPPESRTTSHWNQWTNCAGIRKWPVLAQNLNFAPESS
jgi:hypothetical protein